MTMLDDDEETIRLKIEAYLRAGYSLADIRQAGWGQWIDLLKVKGCDLREYKLGLQPPETAPAPGRPSIERTEPPPALGVPTDRNIKESPTRRNSGLVMAAIVLAGLVVISFALAEFSDNDDASGGRSNSTRPDTSSSTVLKESAVVFVGGYSEAEIKRKLDRAMNLYNHPISESNYDGATNMLVQFRLDYGVREMDVLDTMIRSHVPGVNITFVDAASIAAAILSVLED